MGHSLTPKPLCPPSTLCRSKQAPTAAAGLALSHRLQALKTIRKQLTKLPPPPKATPQQWEAAGAWMSAEEVVAFVDRVKASGELAIPSLDGSVFGRREAAGELHQAIMAVLSFGYLPPVRGEVGMWGQWGVIAFLYMCWEQVECD